MSEPIRFHLSMNVTDLAKSVAYFRTLFGREPAKLRSDYAKFEPDEPPLVLSLEPAATVSRGGALNHVGLRMPDVRSLVAMQERLERAGLSTKREDGVECCYAMQTKFWAHDPDNNLWEIYTLDGDIEHRGEGQSEAVVLGTVAAPTIQAPSTYEHRMGDAIPANLPHADGSLTEVQLRGTFNGPMTDGQKQMLLAEVCRVLRPGGRVFVHVLCGEQTVTNPDLPGPAGGVQAVPFEGELPKLLADAGFQGIRLLKFEAKPCFVRAGVGMRELQLEGFAPAVPSNDRIEMVYRGPHRSLTLDDGTTLLRGVRVSVAANAARELQRGESAGQFTTFPSIVKRATEATSCGA